MRHPNDLIDSRSQALVLGLTPSSLKTFASRYRDTFPPVYRRHGRLVYRSRSELLAWQAERPGGGNGRPRKDSHGTVHHSDHPPGNAS